MGIPRSDKNTIHSRLALAETEVTIKSGRLSASNSSKVENVGAAQRRPSSARLSGLRATTPAKGNCSGRSRAIRKKNSARQPLPMIPKERGMGEQTRRVREVQGVQACPT